MLALPKIRRLEDVHVAVEDLESVSAMAVYAPRPAVPRGRALAAVKRPGAMTDRMKRRRASRSAGAFASATRAGRAQTADKLTIALVAVEKRPGLLCQGERVLRPCVNRRRSPAAQQRRRHRFGRRLGCGRHRLRDCGSDRAGAQSRTAAGLHLGRVRFRATSCRPAHCWLRLGRRSERPTSTESTSPRTASRRSANTCRAHGSMRTAVIRPSGLSSCRFRRYGCPGRRRRVGRSSCRAACSARRSNFARAVLWHRGDQGRQFARRLVLDAPPGRMRAPMWSALRRRDAAVGGLGATQTRQERRRARKYLKDRSESRRFDQPRRSRKRWLPTGWPSVDLAAIKVRSPRRASLIVRRLAVVFDDEGVRAVVDRIAANHRNAECAIRKPALRGVTRARRRR